MDIARDHSREEILTEIEKLDKRHYGWIRNEAAELIDRRVEQLDALVNYHPPIAQSSNGANPPPDLGSLLQRFGQPIRSALSTSPTPPT